MISPSSNQDISRFRGNLREENVWACPSPYPLSDHTLINNFRRKKLYFYEMIILTLYASKPQKNPIKTHIFSLLLFFWLSLSTKISRGKGEEVKAQGGVFLPLRRNQVKIVMGDDRTSPCLGHACRRALWDDLD